MPAGVVFPLLACLPSLWHLWPRAFPLALAAAALPLVKAGKPYDDPMRLSSEGIRFWRTFGDARATATSPCVDPRRPFARALAFRAFRRIWPPRARSAATPSSPPSLVRSPDCASSDPTAAFRLLQLTRPVGAPCCERSTLARAGCRALAEHPPRLPRYPSPRGAGAFRASRLATVRSARQRATRPLARLAGREARDEGSAQTAWSPSSFLLPSTRLSPMHRHAGLECLRRARCGQRLPFPRRPAKGAVFPKAEGAFHRTFHVPIEGFPPRRGDGWSLLSRCFPRGVSMARGGPAPFFRSSAPRPALTGQATWGRLAST